MYLRHETNPQRLGSSWGRQVTILLALSCGVAGVACGGEATQPGDGDGDGDGGVSGDGDEQPAPGDGDGDSPIGTTMPPATVTVDNGAISAVDLLFVIDNSRSMLEKQMLLERAAPQMIERLANPFCKTAQGELTENLGMCAAGSQLEFEPVSDLHVGVITTSLGGHGGDLCLRDNVTRHDDDQAYLIPKVRSLEATADPDLTGFLSWNGGDQAERSKLKEAFAQQIQVVGDTGCGFEAPLEAWYRFLVDPQPPLEMVIESARAVSSGVDQAVLAQREAFLRPASAVAIVILTDENDCSLMDGGSYYNNASFGYLLARPTFELPLATVECEVNPNDACCFSCLQASNPPPGCEAQASACDMSEALSASEDRVNVRCFEGQRRFGLDLLYPTSRYSEALSHYEIVDAQSGELVLNPLLSGAGMNQGKGRPANRIFIGGIVGVPWQDVATAASLDLNSEHHELLSAAELRENTVDANGQALNRWEVMLGRPGFPMSSQLCTENPLAAGCGKPSEPPFDPFMIESIAPRPSGSLNPISGEVIVGVESNDPLGNHTNGHELDTAIPSVSGDGPAHDILQFACIFPLETVRVECSPDDLSCECGDEPSYNRPICNPPGGGAPSNTQYFERAVPGTRILQVLKDAGDQALVASICPKVTTGPTTSPFYGYNPAFTALGNMLGQAISDSQ